MLFPLLGLLAWSCSAGWASADLRLGFFYLCALPSTVSSSVALTAAARGTVAAAVFNATLSSVLGILVTPLWVSFVAATVGQPIPVGKVMLDLLVWLFLPLAAGQAARPWLGAWAGRNKPRIQIVDRLTILLLVYTSFCDSMKAGVWSAHGWAMVAGTAAACAGLFALVVALIRCVARGWAFPREDTIAAIFCGSKKTLASGVPMARLIFGAHPALSLILLPIMIYHSLQLVAGGILAARFGGAEARSVSDPRPTIA